MDREDPPPPPAQKARSGAKDVARLAGVSTATVSRVLNKSVQVDPATRQKVLDAAAKLRYVPHGAARMLRSHRSMMMGAIVPSFDYALYARTTSALQQRLDARGYALVLAEHHYDLAAETRIAGQLVERGVDAFVLVGLDHEQALFSLLEDYGRPYVLTWGVDPSRRHPSIGFDNRAATYQVGRHLIALGHRRIGLLSAPLEGNDRARTRGEGLRAALAEAGLALDARHVAHAPISLPAAEEGMNRLLAAPERPTAVVATNDVFAVGAMMACRKAGLRIPQDISITGVDNTDLGATQTPGLTSVATPITEIGRAAADQLAARLEGQPFEPFQEYPVQLVHRGSTGAPAAAPAPSGRAGRAGTGGRNSRPA
ncbi:LacI family DNA-binding transcriptional regulator [Variovorax sp.]|uniref:LacI family DNA-binding transcriptional regulator n=1 Tax=Variovorax sp. TaxID=1871043 RepID=UPI002D34B687|nr:LacI family DNA-binding transcriptional regulator [Variovorax sp.]HYP84339.1 LacI family DNA-binding transcriptional regulator [Variovorax sp.]